MWRSFFATFALCVSVFEAAQYYLLFGICIFNCTSVCGYDGVDNSYNALTQMIVRLPIPNTSGVYETRAYDGFGNPVMRYSWTSITAPYANVHPCQNVAHQ